MQCFIFVMLNGVKHPAEQPPHHGFFVRLRRIQNDICLRISDSPH